LSFFFSLICPCAFRPFQITSQRRGRR
jgi:hypothetical protein